MISIQFSDDLGTQQTLALKKLLASARVRRWVQHALRVPHADDAITLRIVGTDEGRALNKSYRRKNYATNVLTFDYLRSPCVQADIVLCAEVVEREASEQGKDLTAHWAHLIIHGVLHAQGYEHETDEDDALEMEALEVLLMSALGYPDPY